MPNFDKHRARVVQATQARALRADALPLPVERGNRRPLQGGLIRWFAMVNKPGAWLRFLPIIEFGSPMGQ